MTEVLRNSILGPVNYRPLKELRSPGLIVEPPKHRMSVARIRVAIPAQLKAVEKLLEPKVPGNWRGHRGNGTRLIWNGTKPILIGTRQILSGSK